MNRPRILHIYKDYYPPVLGGIEMTIRLMALGCLDEFDVTVLVNSGSRRTTEEMIEGVRVVRVGEWGRFASAPLSPAFPFRLRELSGAADLLHFHFPNPTGDAAYFLAGRRRPYVITYHSDIVRQRLTGALIAPLLQRMLDGAACIMPTSEPYIASSPLLRTRASKCRVLPLGIDLAPYDDSTALREAVARLRASAAGMPTVLFVGRLRYYKGLHDLLAAAPEVPARILIGGTGPEEPGLRALAAASPARERIHFLGELSESDKIAHLHAADLFCLPSNARSEAFGICLIEAMASGLPLVTTRLGTGVEFVNQDGVTGLTVPPASPSGLAAALNLLLGDESLRRQFSAAARERARTEFAAPVMVRRLQEVYRSVLVSNQPGARR